MRLWRGREPKPKPSARARALWPILITLSESERQRGQPAEADALRKQAREIVNCIAHQIATPEFRASFLGLPQVKALLST